MLFSFECSDCFTECLENEEACTCCGADLTNDVEVEDDYEDDGQPSEMCGADLTNEVDASDYDCDDDDGQPSEMQEWHDFDPDC